MPIARDSQVEERAILAAANLIAASARTAPKARGVDNIKTAVVYGEEKDQLADMMERRMERKRNPLQAFKRDAQSVRKSPVIVLIGVKGTSPKIPENPLNCGACGNASCADFIKVQKKKGEDYTGPICIFEAMDLGIALGSAVKMASELNIDNRIMYTAGAAAKDLQLLDADVIVGIPLSMTGKNIFFDR
ncbi:hypothetical protein KEJ18_05090 [Candidatus Bathyarchaeota archaeon]|nr:hypothetical protein [Candidatus Bathyarchaeota archaeon]